MINKPNNWLLQKEYQMSDVLYKFYDNGYAYEKQGYTNYIDYCQNHFFRVPKTYIDYSVVRFDDSSDLFLLFLFKKGIVKPLVLRNYPGVNECALIHCSLKYFKRKIYESSVTIIKNFKEELKTLEYKSFSKTF